MATETDYISELKELVCDSGKQVDDLIKNVLRKEYWVVNGDRPNGQYAGTGRVRDFLTDKELIDPKNSTTSNDDGSTTLQRRGETDDRPLNNNPEYRPNMIEVLNTPFDHVERIVLQDLSGVMGLPDKENNYFKGLFAFAGDSDGKFNGGIPGFTMSDGEPPHVSDFGPVNDVFNSEVNRSIGGFFVDSFTYTPFVDYSQVGEGGDDRVGVYCDQFLTDYNIGKYDVPESQVDVHRRTLTSTLYRLGNLKKDIEAAKVAFRKAVADQDRKTYIYTFCEHLATLFAKLSNIRMSHEIYGFKHPHCQWEGILALDIFYNLLYKEIDARYPFDDKYLNMNPMARLLVQSDATGQFVVYGERKLYRNSMPSRMSWMVDDADPKYALVWDSSIWEAYKANSSAIRDTRPECTTPRGVLKKIHALVMNGVNGSLRNDILRKIDGDYAWFEQKGKVYSSLVDCPYTKYVNLHLGLAYDVMTGREYYELTEDGYDEDAGTYTKPEFSDVANKTKVKDDMLSAGVDAIDDAFAVVRNERLFNIFNSSTGKVESFSQDSSSSYSQSQCAIVIERVFSRIYKYLQFKSTTSETFQRHINIDSGYKYHTTESLLGSDHGLECYYDPSDPDGKQYLRYLHKLKSYLASGAVDIGLTNDEKEVLENFCQVLTLEAVDWLKDKWDLCPLLKVSDNAPGGMSPRKLTYRGLVARDGEDRTYDLFINFNRLANMSWSGEVKDNLESLPEDWNIEWRGDVLHITLQGVDDSIDLGQIKVKQGRSPTYTYTEPGRSLVATYHLAGYSHFPNSHEVVFNVNSFLSKDVFPNGADTMQVFAAWTPDFIVKYDSSGGTGQSMPAVLLQSGERFLVPKCAFTPPGGQVPTFTYHNDSSWQDISAYVSPTVQLQKFSYWGCHVLGHNYHLRPGQNVNVEVVNPDTAPVLVLSANWKFAYDVMHFTVMDKPYCDVLIDRDLNTLVWPDHDPELQDSAYGFMGWSIAEGSYLSGVDANPNIICEDCEEPIVCEGDIGPIICHDDQPNEYQLPVVALVSEVHERNFVVRFLFKNDNGDADEKSYSVQQNLQIPTFHIRNSYQKEEEGENYTYTFKYWRLESGDLTSSFTVLSDCTFVAVYDKTVKPLVSDTTVDVIGLGEMGLDSTQSELDDFSDCEYMAEYLDSSGSEILDGHTHDHYCTLTGLDPHRYDVDFGELSACPYVQYLKTIYEDETKKAKPNDFRQMTMIEVGDVANLLKALFKVNIDIAHQGYFLKIDMPEASNWWYGYKDEDKWISFEPIVELKFSNLHAANQEQNGSLICSAGRGVPSAIVPVNRELSYCNANKCVQYSDIYYDYDYHQMLRSVGKVGEHDELIGITPTLDDNQNFYEVKPLCLYENSTLQSPTDMNDYVRHRLDVIERSNKQVQTFTSIVKKYRPVIMPEVRSIFSECQGQTTKYECDRENDYGVFGWCTIPSKTMVNMEYNEGALYVPSSYDHHNRVGGSNFLQMDSDLRYIYQKWVQNAAFSSEDVNVGRLEDCAADSWCWLYNTRDWTYFVHRFFNMHRNSELYSDMLDTYGYDETTYQPDAQNNESLRPKNSNHINGVIFEHANSRRADEPTFGQVASTCQFLAKYHHGKNNLHVLAERFTNLLSYSRLAELTKAGDFNDYYGSECADLPKDFRFPIQDWVDDHDKTSSYYEYTKYAYNLGQAHAIDDFDEDSVWFYITMVEPIEQLDQVIELEDIMPFVFWWDNRGLQNNGPDVDCYGLASNAKLNYQQGGWCWSCAHERQDEDVVLDANNQEVKTPIKKVEQKWHAVAHTLGMDFSKDELGGAVLTTDNSGNVYKGAFDPNCAGTDEKWKVHHPSNEFGTNQHEDPIEDKYYHGEQAHGNGQFQTKVVPDSLNEAILGSIKDRPMTWNLWNVVRHYAYIKYFKNKHRALDNDSAAWSELEKYTKKIVKGIYRTFREKKGKTFGEVDEISTNYGDTCNVHWTNSFIEVSTVLERNAREHQASFVVFTGDIPTPTIDQLLDAKDDIARECGVSASTISDEIARARVQYFNILDSQHSFRVLSLAGVDANDAEDGICPRVWSDIQGKWIPDQDNPDVQHVFQGFKYGDLPTTFVLGDTQTMLQSQTSTLVRFKDAMDMDVMYPESEFRLNDMTNKWVRKIQRAVLERQILPIYTSMEGMNKDVHDLTMDEMKSITFQVVPSFYWRYEWSYNDYMIHFVGRKDAPNESLPFYDMLGNVWEWVRDDWSDSVAASIGGTSSLPATNPIVGTDSDEATTKKVVKGGAYDQLVRKALSATREAVSRTSCRQGGNKIGNIGFRPAFTFTAGQAEGGVDKIDLFFLFDATATQNDQLENMLDSAKEIVKKFVHDKTSDKDFCHVTSALFVGPTARIMCGQKVKTLEQPVYIEGSAEVTYKGNGQGGTSYFSSQADYYNNVPWNSSGKQVSSRKDWIKVGNWDYYSDDGVHWLDGENFRVQRDFSDVAKCISGKNYAGKQSGLRVKYDNYFNNVWMSDAPRSSRREQPMRFTARSLDKSSASYEDSTPILRGEGGHTTGGGGSTKAGEYTGTKYTIKYLGAESGMKQLNVFTGVPAWQDDTGGLHFGDLLNAGLSPEDWSTFDQYFDNNSQKGEDNNPYRNPYNFFTYDISPNGVDTFEYPFTSHGDKGALSNWWAGCECVCDMVQKLLDDGFVYGYPYNGGFGGHLFRKNVPRLIFVFSNEFDNALSRRRARYLTSEGPAGSILYSVSFVDEVYNVVVVPTTTGNKKVTFYADAGNSDLNSTLTAPDPYCLQLLRENDLEFNVDKYIKKVLPDIDPSDPAYASVDGAQKSLANIRKLVINSAGKPLIGELRYIAHYNDDSSNHQYIPCPTKLKVSGTTNTACAYFHFVKQQSVSGHREPSLKVRDLDLNDINKPINFSALNILNPVQSKAFSGPRLADLGYTKTTIGEFWWKASSIDTYRYDSAKTISYYQLMDRTRKVQECVNTFLMVSDANAPRPLYNGGNDPYSLSLVNDFLMVRDLVKIPLPQNIVSAIDRLFTSDSQKKKLWNSCHVNELQGNNVPAWDWTTILAANTQYLRRHPILENGYRFTWKNISNNAKKWLIDGMKEEFTVNAQSKQNFNFICNVMGIQNPYERRSILCARRLNNATKYYNASSEKDYVFILGLPSGLNMNGVVDPSVKEGYWRSILINNDFLQNDKGDNNFKKYLKPRLWEVIKEHLKFYKNGDRTTEEELPNASTWTNREWYILVRAYATNDDSNYPYRDQSGDVWELTEDAAEWVDKHICPYELWNDRRKEKRLCKWNLTEENLEYFALTARPSVGNEYIYGNKTSPCVIANLYNNEAFPGRFNPLKNNSYIFSSEPLDYVMLEYRHLDESTGSLKIVTLPESLWNKKRTPDYNDNTVRSLPNDIKLVVAGGDEFYGMVTYACLVNTEWSECPKLWKLSHTYIAHQAYKNQKTNGMNKRGVKIPSAVSGSLYNYNGFFDKIWNNQDVLGFVKQFYADVKNAAPLMLAYRYQCQILDNLVNSSGFGLTDYDIKDNFMIAKALPVMDASKIYDTFIKSFSYRNVSSSSSFSASACVVDLNPSSSEYAELNGQFPLKFASGNIPNDDEYKTTKLVLARVGAISGTNYDTFDMGSRASDYSIVTDPIKRKYRDKNAIVDGAVDDKAVVTLGNGGTYQKKFFNTRNIGRTDQQLPGDYIQENDMFIVKKQDEPEENKYQRNKHFFLAPFELTIAQWCYINLNSQGAGTATKDSARGLLSEHLPEIRESYWKYLSIWEPELWNELKEQYKNHQRGVDDDIVEIDESTPSHRETTVPVDDTDEFIKWLVAHDDSYGIYNPLEDMRPYYYATYDAVRGTGQVYSKPSPQPTRWTDFVMDSRKGDDFYMCLDNDHMSFLEILNSKVVYKTRPLSVTIDPIEGGEVVDYEQEGDPPHNKDLEWCSGQRGGLNFDLPTEAQWEYCCRLGSNTAIPPSYDIGDTFETSHSGLDLIAWYKYKVIGSNPEPERFAAWRISKMLFGIGKDKEQINSVYETTKD